MSTALKCKFVSVRVSLCVCASERKDTLLFSKRTRTVACSPCRPTTCIVDQTWVDKTKEQDEDNEIGYKEYWYPHDLAQESRTPLHGRKLGMLMTVATDRM